MKNKPDWLDAALAGAPVVLRYGNKAYVRYWEKEFESDYSLYGGVILSDGRMSSAQWTTGGSFHRIDEIHNNDIIGLWKEPAPVFEYWHLLKEDYVAIAMDKYGVWCAYSRHVPYVSERHSIWLFDGVDCYHISELFAKDVLPNVSDWRQSLILRPEGENK